jgi:hypothetical protein
MRVGIDDPSAGQAGFLPLHRGFAKEENGKDEQSKGKV